MLVPNMAAGMPSFHCAIKTWHFPIAATLGTSIAIFVDLVYQHLCIGRKPTASAAPAGSVIAAHHQHPVDLCLLSA